MRGTFLGLLAIATGASALMASARVTPRCSAPRCAAAPASSVDEVDVVVIGSGLAGLSCAGLMASRGYKVAVLEQHYEIGGCAHEFNVNLEGRPVPSEVLARKPEPVFKFEAGPSLYSGLSMDKSPNPLKHIFQMIGEEPEWINYDTWGGTSRTEMNACRHRPMLLRPATTPLPLAVGDQPCRAC